MIREMVYKNFDSISPKQLIDDFSAFEKYIRNEFDFEGKDFLYSLKPIIISNIEDEYFAKSTQDILKIVELALKNYFLDPHIRHFFSYYEKFNRFLDIENIHKRYIALARFDTVWFGGENYKIFEFNTCCPGGVAILGLIKKQYCNLPSIKQNIPLKSIVPFLCDSPENFIKNLVEYYHTSSAYRNQKDLGIAFVNCDGLYTYELKELQKTSQQMGYNSVICDIQSLKYNNGRLYYNDMVIDIIYNKIDQLMLSKDKICDVYSAVVDKKVVSISSYPAMYLSESKMMLALLHSDYFQNKYLDTQQKNLISKHIPWTSILEDKKILYKGSCVELIPFITSNKDDFVIKIDNKTRGEQVYIGADMHQDTWKCCIDKLKNSNWIVQEYFKLPEIKSLQIVDNKLVGDYKKFGLDFFLYNGKYAGIVSRVSKSKIINVGAGGAEQPVFVIKEDENGK